VFAEASPQYAAFCHHACKNTECASNHPSEFRGKPGSQLQWYQPEIGSGLVLSDGGTVVDFPGASVDTTRIARASTACTANSNGVCEWDTIVESVGSGRTCSNRTLVGIVPESYQQFDGWISNAGWCFQSFQHSPQQEERYFYSNGQSMKTDLGKQIQNGDIISFRLNFNDQSQLTEKIPELSGEIYLIM